jgi:AcrR family transcriptional regulator
MPMNTVEMRKRLTREESRAQTRSRLIATGREHFLRCGLGGAVAETIAEDAGYSRGALYSNFDGKEELFLAVIHEEQARYFDIFRSILKEDSSGREKLKKMRDTFTDIITDRDWIVLRSEFETEALRNERIRESYVQLHRQLIRDGRALVRDLMRTSEITLRMKPDDFIMAMLVFSHGLAVNQKILGIELPQKSTRILIQGLFDLLISAV